MWNFKVGTRYNKCLTYRGRISRCAQKIKKQSEVRGDDSRKAIVGVEVIGESEISVRDRNLGL